MKQTIIISGIKNKYPVTHWTPALTETLSGLNQIEQPVLNYIGEQEAAGNVKITRVYDRENDTITIQRVWTKKAYADYKKMQENIDFVMNAIRGAGYTVSISTQ